MTIDRFVALMKIFGIICDLLFTALPVVLFFVMIIAGKLLPDKLDDEDDGYDEYEDFWWTCP